MKNAPAVSLLALVVAASYAATPAIAPAATVVPIAKLSAQERLTTAPADAQVIVDGRTVTLAVLRSEHEARMARLRSGVNIPAPVALSIKSSASKTSFDPVSAQRPGLAKFLAPTPRPPKDYTLVTPAPVSYTLPADYVKACSKYPGYLCTFLPYNTTLVRIDQDEKGATVNELRDTDPLITDSSVCGEEGGVLTKSGCAYSYPYEVHLQYDATKKAASTTYLTCTSVWSQVLDPHGAEQIMFYKLPAVGQTVTTPPDAQYCYIEVQVYTRQ